MADNTIDNLSIQVTASAENAARVFDRLASSAGRLRGAASGAAGGMEDMAQGARDAGTETQKAGEQSGSAAPKIRGVGRDAKTAGDNAKKGASGLANFWQSLKRIAFYRAIRSIIKGITEAFQTGITNLYHWSDAINGHFAAAMDRLATSSLYLKNSLGAMVSPLIESFIPVLDTIIDKVVEVLNFFNMLVSAVSGADTYTIAKKTAAVWDASADKTKKSAKSAADDIKRTILGFDEINKLVKPNSSSGGSGSSSGTKTPDYSSMFEEKPLTGLFKKISDITSGWPDWLKALMGVGTAGLAIFGIPALLKKIWDGLKNLFGLKVPSWFSRLFGGKGGAGINIPDEIKFPESEIPVEPVMSLTPDEVFDSFEDAWNQSNKELPLTPALDNNSEVLYNNFKRDWENAGSKTLYFSPKLDNVPSVLYNNFKRDWDNAGSKSLYFSPKLDNRAKILYGKFMAEWENAGSKILYFSPKLDNTGTVLYGVFKNEWDDAGSKILYFSPKLDNTANVLYNNFKREWDGAGSKILYFSPKLDNTAYVLLSAFKRDWSNGSPYVTVYVNLSKGNYFTLNDWVGTWVDVAVYLTQGNFWSLSDWLGDSVTVRVDLSMGSGGVINVNGVNNRGFGGGQSAGGGAGRGRRANGGILSGMIWQDLPKYAGGTSSAHGTMFLAGEAGPEIVGHVGGRTEVLNKSQIASAMYSAVQAAMAPASANFAAAAYAMNADTTTLDMEMLAEMVRQGVESAMERERDILRQQLDTLRQINDKDTTVEVSTSSINKAQTRMNRRIGRTVVPVGT